VKVEFITSTSELNGGEWLTLPLDALPLRKENRYPTHRRLARYGKEKDPSLPGAEPRIYSPQASHYIIIIIIIAIINYNKI
jgi:hypothetical protein